MSSALAAPRPGLWVALAALAGLVLLTLAVTQGDTAALDRRLLAAFAALRSPVLDAFFLSVTWLGSNYVLAPAAILAILALAARRQWAAARLLGLTYFGAFLMTLLLKMAVGRERPLLHAALAEFVGADWSFPSGHTTHAAAFALGLWLLAARHRPRWRVSVGIVLGTVAGLVAISRLYLQVHWPSDVLAGLLVGVLWAGLAAAAGRDGRTTGRTTCATSF